MADLGNYDETAGDWHFRVRPARNGLTGFVGFAKRGAFVTDDVGMDEPGEIFFNLAPTAEAVLRSLKAEVLH